MNSINTKHAVTRMRQRCIPPVIIDLLQDFGTEQHEHNGAVRYSFDRRSLKRLQSYVGPQLSRVVEEYRDCCAVISMDGVTITTYHRCH